MIGEYKKIESYRTIDEVLGDSRTRYFGAGYRMVQQRVFDVRIDTLAQTVAARAQVKYPSSWSIKPERELTPHLSSIDGIVIAAQMVEAYVREAFGVDDVGVRDCWIRYCAVKSGSMPTLQLDDIPCRLTLLATRPDSDTLCGHLSDFRVTVGSLNVDVTIDHPLVTDRRARRMFSAAEAGVGDDGSRYYAGGYKRSRVAVSDVVLNRTGNRASAMFEIERAAEEASCGLSGAYMPYLSIPDALVGTAQLTQLALYHQDNLTRATSRNMWMRKIAISIPAPFETRVRFGVEVRLSQATVLPVGDQRWRTAKFNVTLPSMTAEYSVAHELPAQEIALAKAG